MSTTESPALLMQAAAEVASLAATTAMRWFHQRIDVEVKGDGSPVTIADREAERVAREWLATRFPNDALHGEEYGYEPRSGTRRWLLDPIDGTKAFVRGVPLWGTLVACCEGDTVIAGAACFPAVNETIVAARGEGCWWNGSRTAVSTVNELAHATALSTDTRFLAYPERGVQWRALAEQVNVARTWGDCYGYLLVATGRADIMVDEIVNPWDTAAIYPIITEAGGRFTAWDGVDTAFGSSAIATNAALDVATRRILTEPFQDDRTI